jgi:hypothetical protein
LPPGNTSSRRQTPWPRTSQGVTPLKVGKNFKRHVEVTKASRSCYHWQRTFVTLALPWYHMHHTTSHWHHSDVTLVMNSHRTNIPLLSYWHHTNVTHLSHLHCNDIVCVTQHWRRRDVTVMLHRYCMVVRLISHFCLTGITLMSTLMSQ